MLRGMRDACAVIETVRESIWKRGQRPPVWMEQLVDDICRDAGVLWMRPELVVTKVDCDTTFGGRWFAGRNGIGVIIHPSKVINYGVTVHECGHYLRWVFGGDETGEHDEEYYALMERLYQRWGVSFETAMTIEHAPPRRWREKRLW